MWTTSRGERVLAGNEARLFRSLALDLQSCLSLAMDYQENLDEVDAVETGVDAFDRLTAGQQAVVLSEVVAGLLDPQEPARKLTAVHEAAILAIYRAQDEFIANAHEQGKPCTVEDAEFQLNVTYMKLDKLNAARDLGMKDLPDAESKDTRQWEMLSERLADCVLFDRDYESVQSTLDLAPELAHLVREKARIKDTYASYLPPDPRTPGDLEPYWNRLNKVLVNQMKIAQPKARRQ